MTNNLETSRLGPVRWIGLLCVLSLVAAAQDAPPNPRDQFVEVASLLRAFPPDLDYEPSGPGNPTGRRLARGFNEYWRLLQADHPIPLLLSLIRDPDPKIRTLAAKALAAKGDPRLLQNLRPLLADPAPTFDFVNGLPDVNFMSPSYGRQSVSVAVLGIVEKRDTADFDRYWAKHADLAYCADWFLWQFWHGPAGRIYGSGASFALLSRKQLLRVPSPDRELITLWVGTGPRDAWPAQWFSEAEVLAAAKALGRDRALAILRRQPLGSDPDFAPDLQTGSGGQYAIMTAFLLSHVKDLLRPSDTDTLLGIEEAERARNNAWDPPFGVRWPVAAATLRPEGSAPILDQAGKRYPESAEIPLARWRISGLQALPLILRWFYRSPAAERNLISAISSADSNRQYEPLVEAILSSPDRLRVNGEAMWRIAELAGKWKTRFDDRFVDWIFAQPLDPNPNQLGTRSNVARYSGVVQKVILDDRFLRADAQLVCELEPFVSGSGKFTVPQLIRLGQLIPRVNPQRWLDTPEPLLQEIRNLLREGIANQ